MIRLSIWPESGRHGGHVDIYRRIAEWTVPVLMAAATYSLQQINSEMSEISKSLAVAVQKIEDHDRRLENLETLYLKRP